MENERIEYISPDLEEVAVAAAKDVLQLNSESDPKEDGEQGWG